MSDKINWNEMEEIATKFHKGFKSSKGILDVVKAIRSSESIVQGLQSQEQGLVGSVEFLKGEEERLKISNGILKDDYGQLIENEKKLLEQIVKLDNILDAGHTERKELLEEQYREIESEAIMEHNNKEQARIEQIRLLDVEIGAKQRMATEIKETIKNLGKNLALAEKS